MKGKVFLLIFIALLFGAYMIVASSSSTFRIKGVFNTQNWWTGWIYDLGSNFLGNPWKIDFDSATGLITSTGAFSGNFWLGNVGWASFDVPGAEMIIQCPNNILNIATQLCYISGAAWSENAGWIVFSSGAIGVGSGAYYDPNTASISGWWWNEWLGWVPLWSGLSGALSYSSSTNIPAPITSISLHFVSKIAIVGNIAGTRVYSVTNSGVTNQDVGYTYKTVNHASILNLLRKNIALMTRNIDPARLVDNNLINPFDFVLQSIDNMADPDFDFVWSYVPSKKSIIVIGGDIILDQEDINSNSINLTQPIWLIALKDSTGSGWNIIISDKVKRISAYMYAEWSIFSGEKSATGHIMKYTDNWPFGVPQWQIYIRWLAASKNTIWWAQQSLPTPICPMLVDNCDLATAQSYDWDYFRNFDPTDPLQRSIPTTRNGQFPSVIQDSVMIIDYDEWILTDPPPGFREM